MNGKQAKALGLSLLVASSCMAVDWKGLYGKATERTKAFGTLMNDHRLATAGIVGGAVVATAGGVELNRRRNARNARLATQKAEATRQANRTWLDKALGR